MPRKDTSHLARRKQAVADGGGNARTRKMRQRRVDLGVEAPATGGGARVSEGTPIPPEVVANPLFSGPASGQEDVLDANARTMRDIETRRAFNPYTLYQGLK